MPVTNQDGLEWDSSGWNLTPVWTREPSVDAILIVCRQRLHIDDNDACEVSFHAQGAFNKLYLVRLKDQSFLMRISLPVCPHHKTRGEVTTLRWVRENTDIPVPKIIDFDDSSKNEIGFEWILMELMSGTSAWRRWRHMTMAQKVVLTQRIAEFQAQLFRHGSSVTCFRGVGTLESTTDQALPAVGQFVSTDFFMGDHIEYDVPRGPFRSSHDWLKSALLIVVLEHEKGIATAEDEEDKGLAEKALLLAKRLLALLPNIFPSMQVPQERTALWHDDLGLGNILVDEDGDIAAIVDWECVSAMPLWKTMCMPKFLEGRDRDKEPKRENYSDETPAGSVSSAAKDADPDELDNEGIDELYWINLLEYEKTQLRKIYIDKMRSLWPDWDLILNDNKLKNDFLKAVYYCSSGFYITKLLKWVDMMEAGEFIDLTALDIE